jgi:TrmH family RNA methyltransferase
MPQMISSVQNDLVKHWVKLRHNRDYRYDHMRILVEGKNVIAELCQSLPSITLIASREDLVPPHAGSASVILVSDAVMAKITEVAAPEGLLAEVPLPSWTPLKAQKWIVVLDGVSDPGNLGTLIRTALALGWEGIYLLDNCCDPFNDKALRAAKGATFKIPLNSGNWDKLKQLASEQKLPLYGADVQGAKPGDVAAREGMILVLGNEAHGLSASAKALAKPVTIPMSGLMESLNVGVAGGILMYLLRNGRE